jgi:phosphohistidine phosphatase
MKRLLLLRHAKTEQSDKDTPADSERPLTERGRTDAQLIGRAMREKGYVPDLVICSPSVRTRETLQLAHSESGGDARTEFPDGLYAAGKRQILQIVQGASDRAGTLLLVGHNPGFEECAALLAGKSGDASAQARFSSAPEKFPTASLAVLDFQIPHWKNVEPHEGMLVDFIRPKDLKSS